MAYRSLFSSLSCLVLNLCAVSASAAQDPSTTASHAQIVTVALLEGEPIQGLELRFVGNAVEIAGRSVLLADCDWITWQDPAVAVAPQPPRVTVRSGLWLARNGWLPCGPLRAAAVPDAVLVDGPLGSFTVPLAQIEAWGVHAPVAPADGADRVMLASGPVDGRIRGIVDGKLLLASSLDPEPLDIALADVAGLRIVGATTAARPVSESMPEVLVSLDAQRPPLRLQIRDGSLALVLPGHAPQPVQRETLGTARLVVDGGRRQWLSDLTPATEEERGAFDVVWPWARDAAIGGGPLVLGGVRHAKGLTVHSAARLAWNIDGKYRRLRAAIGIADAYAPEGDCPVSLIGDGSVRWKRDRLRGGEAPVAVDIDLTGVQHLELVIELGERYDIGDHVVLGSAYVVRSTP